MHFLEIICADIVFCSVLCSYRVEWGKMPMLRENGSVELSFKDQFFFCSLPLSLVSFLQPVGMASPLRSYK